jgi:hypothetical protein
LGLKFSKNIKNTWQNQKIHVICVKRRKNEEYYIGNGWRNPCSGQGICKKA